MVISDYTLVETCGACPEQYDVFDESGEQVAYLRLRHGSFTCETPDQDTLIYSANPEGDGAFESDERMFYLTEAVEAIRAYSHRFDLY